jgi:hypothetical protein
VQYIRNMSALIQPHNLFCVLVLVGLHKTPTRYLIVQVRCRNSPWLRRNRLPSAPPTVKKGVLDDVQGDSTVADRKCNFLATRKSFQAVFGVLKTLGANLCKYSKTRYQRCIFFLFFLINEKKKKRKTSCVSSHRKACNTALKCIENAVQNRSELLHTPRGW